MAPGFLLSIILLISGQSGGETPAAEASTLATRPACIAENHLQMWPPWANDSAAEANALAKSGRLEICTRGAWRYRWTSPTVHISQLAHKGKH
jgi:hypothetical protein